jgi:nitrite reductase/ring-hydroxylating ferredoxin subunit
MNRWIPVAGLADVPEGQTLAVDVAGEAVCLYNLKGTLYATQDVCTHEEASLAEGFVEGDCIECPLHQAIFHIPAGKARTAPASVDLRLYPGMGHTINPDEIAAARALLGGLL